MMNATVKLSADKAELLGADAESRSVARGAVGGVRRAVSSKCEVHRYDLGGGFGRRGGTQDYVRQAVTIAKEFPGIPVKLIWSREEDQAHDFFRPISQCKMSAGLDADGNLVGLHVRVSGQSINAWLNPAGIVGGKDRRQLQGFCEEPQRRAARLHRAEHADRVRDAQHACPGRAAGAASTPTRTASTWSASSRSVRGRPARIRWSSAAR